MAFVLAFHISQSQHRRCFWILPSFQKPILISNILFFNCMVYKERIRKDLNENWSRKIWMKNLKDSNISEHNKGHGVIAAESRVYHRRDQQAYLCQEPPRSFIPCRNINKTAQVPKINRSTWRIAQIEFTQDGRARYGEGLRGFEVLRRFLVLVGRVSLCFSKHRQGLRVQWVEFGLCVGGNEVIFGHFRCLVFLDNPNHWTWSTSSCSP
jgi:hypothetical protein